LSYYPDLPYKTDPIKPGIVHRLDKDTSGLMLIAKTESAYKYFIDQFKKRLVKRTYLAITKGVLELDEGIIKIPIKRNSAKRQAMKASYLGGKDAVTYYKVLKRYKEKDASLLLVKPLTGRTHQIRVHLAHIGHPILGDIKYSNIKHKKRMHLHAYKLEFTHPRTKKLLRFFSKLPKELRDFLH
jgi:23S rRNA pseudouridine1911/1915/1917 synthase